MEITENERFVLNALSWPPRAVSFQELLEMSGISRYGLTQAISRLEMKGLIVRRYVRSKTQFFRSINNKDKIIELLNNG